MCTNLFLQVSLRSSTQTCQLLIRTGFIMRPETYECSLLTHTHTPCKHLLHRALQESECMCVCGTSSHCSSPRGGAAVSCYCSTCRTIRSANKQTHTINTSNAQWKQTHQTQRFEFGQHENFPQLIHVSVLQVKTPTPILATTAQTTQNSLQISAVSYCSPKTRQENYSRPSQMIRVLCQFSIIHPQGKTSF